jgi:Flp pilus assembly protein TadG
VFASWKQFKTDESGATMIEMSLTITLFFVFLFGIIDFTHMFFQWNAATKATQFGARIAAVSDPLAANLKADDFAVNIAAGRVPGKNLIEDAGFGFDITCRSNSTSALGVSCFPTINGSTNSISVSQAANATAALRRIVYGSDVAACPANPAPSARGMCHFHQRIRANNVEVRYQFTGLGYAGRPGGAVPTVTVSIRQDDLYDLPFDFIMVGALANLAEIRIPPLSTSVTGEDLGVLAP